MKNIVLILAVMGICLQLTACQNGNELQVVFTNPSYEESVASPYINVNDMSTAKFSIQQNSSIPDALSLKLFYFGTKEFLYSGWFAIEKEIGEEWYTLTYVDNIIESGFSIGTLDSDNTEIFDFHISELYGKLSDGKYRVVTQVAVKNSEEEWQIHYLTDHFTVGLAISESPYTEVNTLENVAVKIVDSSITPTHLTVEYENHGASTLCYSGWYNLEVNQDGKWYTVAPRNHGIDDRPTTEILLAYSVQSGESAIKEYYWSSQYETLPVGTYRIILEVLDRTDKKTHYLAAQFELE